MKWLCHDNDSDDFMRVRFCEFGGVCVNDSAF